MNFIDKFLNSITMYRLVLYSTAILAVLGILFSFFGLLPFQGFYMLLSLIVLLMVCYGTNYLFGKLFKVPINAESSSITALILFLILSPPSSGSQALVLCITAISSMAGKFLLNIKGKHIFNPAALAAWLMAITGIGAATWWIGSTIMLPATLIVTFLIAKKIRRFDLVVSFIVTGLIAILINGTRNGADFFQTLKEAFTSWPLIFFGGVMLSEPLTTPPTKKLRITYGIITGALFGTSFHIGSLYNSPEFSLLLGNIFSYILSPKEKLILKFKEKIQMAPMVFDFVFTPNKKLAFNSGQYLEWTLQDNSPDNRGNRRYFTIASSPTENEIHLGIKIPEKPSTFKQKLSQLKPGEELLAGSLSGDFTLYKEPKEYVAIAGGIGITPFRSHAKEALDKNQKLNMVLFYASSNLEEFVYKDLFKEAEKVGVKTVYILSGSKTIPPEWTGLSGFITKELIEKEVPNYKNRIYYLSGPNVMVEAYKKLLHSLNIPTSQIHTDYFPGY